MLRRNLLGLRRQEADLNAANAATRRGEAQERRVLSRQEADLNAANAGLGGAGIAQPNETHCVERVATMVAPGFPAEQGKRSRKGHPGLARSLG
jgi:hypothetical protein